LRLAALDSSDFSSVATCLALDFWLSAEHSEAAPGYCSRAVRALSQSPL
jgi:hypothetical protein